MYQRGNVFAWLMAPTAARPAAFWAKAKPPVSAMQAITAREIHHFNAPAFIRRISMSSGSCVSKQLNSLKGANQERCPGLVGHGYVTDRAHGIHPGRKSHTVGVAEVERGDSGSDGDRPHRRSVGEYEELGTIRHSDIHSNREGLLCPFFVRPEIREPYRIYRFAVRSREY